MPTAGPRCRRARLPTNGKDSLSSSAPAPVSPPSRKDLMARRYAPSVKSVSSFPSPHSSSACDPLHFPHNPVTPVLPLSPVSPFLCQLSCHVFFTHPILLPLPLCYLLSLPAWLNSPYLCVLSRQTPACFIFTHHPSGLGQKLMWDHFGHSLGITSSFTAACLVAVLVCSCADVSPFDPQGDLEYQGLCGCPDWFRWLFPRVLHLCLSLPL